VKELFGGENAGTVDMRIRKLSCLKFIFVTGFAVFIVINVKSAGENEQALQNDEENVEYGKRNIANIATKSTQELESVYSGSSQASQSKEKSAAVEPEGPDSLAGDRINELPNHFKLREDSLVNTSQDRLKSHLHLKNILEQIKEANRAQIIRNYDSFGPISNDTIVIVVQVHDRIKYLRHLIRSLSLASGIDKTLLIFSHDVWDEQLNYLVRSIDFAKVLQIFYPFSLQTHEHSFPGESHRDCPRDADVRRASALKCINAAWPDIHGHYREAKFTQTKHHWWWKANHVFHTLEVLKDFPGYVLFLEEDHYVSADFLHVLSLMIKEKNNLGSQVDILCLGTYLRKFNFKTNSRQNPRDPIVNGARHARKLSAVTKMEKKEPNIRYSSRQLLGISDILHSVMSIFNKDLYLWPGGPRYSKLQKAEVSEWVSSKHNMGMAFTKTEWNKIVGCSSSFCKYDDYNWDWSLQHVSLNCIKEKLQVMMVKGPRVFHIGECGVHHKKSHCDSDAVIDKLQTILKTASPYFFPESVSVSRLNTRKKIKLKKANGGWGDKRDHWLCMNFTLSSFDMMASGQLASPDFW